MIWLSAKTESRPKQIGYTCKKVTSHVSYVHWELYFFIYGMLLLPPYKLSFVFETTESTNALIIAYQTLISQIILIPATQEVDKIAKDWATMRNPSGSMTGGGNTLAGKTITPCCSKVGIKRGPWTPEEDEILANYVKREGVGKWRTLPKRAGLLRCGKSCRLRWMNYLRPSVKRGHIAPDEEDLILRLHRLLGNR